MKTKKLQRGKTASATRRSRSRLQRVVSQFRVLRLKERIRKGDQFYHYSHPCKWKSVDENTVYIINHFGGVPMHYKGRFRRQMGHESKRQPTENVPDQRPGENKKEI